MVDGDLAREWPRDVTTTPIGSLTKFLAMPLIPAGNLQAFVRANPVRDEDVLLTMVYQLLKAVCTLVDHRLLHRDIKLDNILVREDGTAGGGRSPLRLLLADFGTLQPMANQDRGCTPGNPMKVAPELREQKAAENSEALAEFLADKPDFELQEDGDGKPSIFVHSHQKILECNIGTVTSFYMGKKYQKTLAGGNQGCFF